MAALQIQNEEQLKKAEVLLKSLEIDLRDPLLDDAEQAKLKAKKDRLNAAIQEYQDRTKSAEPVEVIQQPEKQPIVLQEAAPQSRDPRPDLTEDAHLWTELLQLAEEKDQAAGREYGKVDTLCGVLNGFRCGGTRLKPGKVAGNPMWILKPDIDPSGRAAWESIEEYNAMKMQFLSSWGIELTDLLKELSKRHPLNNNNGG